MGYRTRAKHPELCSAAQQQWDYWTGIGTVPAAGNSNITSNYSYVHTGPVTGINYYRILQTDMDNRNSYSDTRTLKFTKTDESFTIIGNPCNE